MSEIFVGENHGEYRNYTTGKIELFAALVNCFQPITFGIKSSILDVARWLDLIRNNSWK